MSSYIRSVTVYLGSSGHARQTFYDNAYKLGQMIARQNIHLVFGGMAAGSMRSISHGAIEHGGKVTGIIPTKIRDSERINRDVSEIIDVPTLWERKKVMFDQADMIIAMPGGYGTLDEALEAVYWKSLGLHNKPIVFLNIDDYWSPFFEWVGKSIQDGIMPESVGSLFHIYDRVGDLKFADYKAEDEDSSASEFPHFENEIFEPTRTPIIIDEATIEQTYKLMTALVLRQLGAHDRPIGVLNKDSQFDYLIEWIYRARDEHFITRQCPSLATYRRTEKGLMDALEKTDDIVIDLHRDKWGD